VRAADAVQSVGQNKLRDQVHVPGAVRLGKDLLRALPEIVSPGDRRQGRFTAYLRIQLIQASEAFPLTAAFTFPDRKGIAPITVAADGPVTSIIKPFAETAFPDMVRKPMTWCCNYVSGVSIR